jgi:queuosine precursor transporter
MTELYGKRRAKLAIWLGLLSSILMAGIIYAANSVPIYTYSLVSQGAFAVVFGFTPGIVLGSMVAYVIAQLVDVYLFDWLRRLTRGKYLWLRNNVATLIGQLFDTAIFAAIAWVLYPMVDTQQVIEPITWSTWYQITRNEYVLKVAFTFINIPLVYVGVYWVKRYIKEAQQ